MTKTLQQWFNVAWKRAQHPVRSWGDGVPGLVDSKRCLYLDPRRPGGHQGCFIGCGITEEEAAKADAEGYDIDDLAAKGLVAWDDVRSVRALQQIHDDEDPSRWSELLQEFAGQHDLAVPR